MAKLKGPLLSLSASGTIADLLTFSERKSGSQVRFQKKQEDVITSGRTAQRQKFTTARDSWDIIELGIAECGFILCGGKVVNLMMLAKDKRAPQFARYVSDFLIYYY
jgi:hypothetical protein